MREAQSVTKTPDMQVYREGDFYIRIPLPSRTDTAEYEAAAFPFRQHSSLVASVVPQVVPVNITVRMSFQL